MRVLQILILGHGAQRVSRGDLKAGLVERAETVWARRRQVGVGHTVGGRPLDLEGPNDKSRLWPTVIAKAGRSSQ